MKKLFLLAIVLLAMSCGERAINEKETPPRIRIKESLKTKYGYYSIIEVDSIEFLASYRGGLVRISK